LADRIEAIDAKAEVDDVRRPECPQ
jgi:hypothetical protein